MKFRFFTLLLFLSLCNGIVKAQNRYDTPAEAPIINTYVPIDFGEIRNIRNQNVQMMKDKLMRAYDAYQYYPDLIGDGWHDVFTVMSNTVMSHRVLVESNRIIKVNIYDKTLNVDIPIVKGRCLTPDFIIYFFKEIEAYNE